MRLYLLRHGQAGAREMWTGSDDLRPLTDEGRAETLAAARGLATLQLHLAVICTSPLTRATQTAELTAEVLGVPITTVSALAPGCQLSDLGPMLATYPDGQNVMLVGHEPDFSEMIGELVAGPSGARIKLKKGACCRVDIPNKAIASATHSHSKLLDAGTLVWLLSASQLTSIGLSTPFALTE